MTKRTRYLRRHSTGAEQALWHQLRRNQLGARFRRQFPIPPFIVDFACVEGRLVIEVDGGQHSAPGDHDRRDAILFARGWRVLRFWNNEVLQNPAGVLATICDALRIPE
ncbi:MAG: endonuclease domain-containing protein [Alphaproteobacteria bacterium]|nr:endonuclease domain-containing protein [Alphaproteobacteria bacterium]